jgi:hypothetical protein
MASSKQDVEHWMHMWQRVESESVPLGSLPWSKSVFSYFEREFTCQGSNQSVIVHDPIEPLVGFLRHPFHVCFSEGDEFNVDKSYMFPSFATASVNRKIKKRNLFFDVGASAYASGAGGASQSWFVETYRKRGIEFDHIYAWEVSHNQSHNLRETPDDILLKMSYFNLPVSSDPRHRDSVVRYISNLAHEDDFIVFKLDIDEEVVEWQIMSSILKDKTVSALIDEVR